MSVQPRLRGVVAAAVLLLPMVMATEGQAADSVANFYKGKNVNMVIGYPPGSGYDVHARALAHFIGKHIPGHPKIVPQNMPGAGSLKAANYVYNVAPKDGTILGAINRSLAMAPLLETDPDMKKKLKFDPLKYNWIGSMDKVISLGICRADTGLTSFDQFKKRQVILTASSPTSDSVVFPTVFNNMLGTKFKIIGGHQGTGGNFLALERNEAECYFGTTYSSVRTLKPNWLKPNNGEMNVVIQIGTEKNENLKNVPLIMEFASKQEQQALELMLAPQVMGRPYMTTPGVPAERVAALRKAFGETMKDPAFLAEAKKIGIEVEPIDGEAIEKLLKRIYKADKNTVELLQKAMPKS
jgi:tripartite-type tricarboxylate transporter receptor subunit TctC